ncbi:hypothetical protein BASA60_008962 [Batrachochytrium salamandrivorans]|nr:hypothetical protein BASA60_008962 [Batrachochytrium salamandrivorans]
MLPLVKSLTATQPTSLSRYLMSFRVQHFSCPKSTTLQIALLSPGYIQQHCAVPVCWNSQLHLLAVRHRDQIGQLFQMTLQSAITEVGRMRVAETKRLAALGRSSTTTELAEVSTAKADTARESVAPSSAT